jgi:hypothetical protein
VFACLIVPEAQDAAQQYEGKYAETSAAINHHVDELLVGILGQIRLKLNPGVVITVPNMWSKSDRKKRRGFSNGPRQLLSTLIRKLSRKKRPSVK